MRETSRFYTALLITIIFLLSGCTSKNNDSQNNEGTYIT